MPARQAGSPAVTRISAMLRAMFDTRGLGAGALDGAGVGGFSIASSILPAIARYVSPEP